MKLTSYDAIKDNLQTMDLLQWFNYGLIGRAIKWRTGGASHSGVVIRYASYEGQDNRRWTLEAVHQGLVPTYLSGKLQRYNGECWLHPLKPEYADLAPYAVSWLMENVGLIPYDLASLLKNIFKKAALNSDALMCSEAVFYSWKVAAQETRDKRLSHLLLIDRSPVPADLTKPDFGLYEENGIRIL